MYLEIDEKKCTGCRLCQQVCAIEHHKEINPKKSAIRIKAFFPVPGTFAPIVCDQCGICAAECPAEAINLKNGIYKIDDELCTGCQYCTTACPSKAMFTHKDCEAPMKCDLCLRCTQVCNTGAIRRPEIRLDHREDQQCSNFPG